MVYVLYWALLFSVLALSFPKPHHFWPFLYAIVYLNYNKYPREIFLLPGENGQMGHACPKNAWGYEYIFVGTK